MRCAAFNALARRDHSVAELKEKLTKKSDNVELVNQVIQTLVENGVVDDARLSTLLAEAKYRQGLGPHRIIALLKTKALCVDAVHNLFTDEQWREGLAKTWGKRFKEKPRDNKSYMQQARYLQYRGFSLEEIKRFLRGH